MFHKKININSLTSVWIVKNVTAFRYEDSLYYISATVWPQMNTMTQKVLFLLDHSAYLIQYQFSIYRSEIDDLIKWSRQKIAAKQSGHVERDYGKLENLQKVRLKLEQN